MYSSVPLTTFSKAFTTIFCEHITVHYRTVGHRVGHDSTLQNDTLCNGTELQRGTGTKRLQKDAVTKR
jgi:hypothetical protein